MERMRRTSYPIRHMPVSDALTHVNSIRIRKHNVGTLHAWENVLHHALTPAPHHVMVDASIMLLKTEESIVLELGAAVLLGVLLTALDLVPVYVKVPVFKRVSPDANRHATIIVSGPVLRIVEVDASKVVRMDAKDVRLVQETVQGIRWRVQHVLVEHVRHPVSMTVIRIVSEWHVVPSVEPKLLEHVKQIAA